MIIFIFPVLLGYSKASNDSFAGFKLSKGSSFKVFGSHTEKAQYQKVKASTVLDIKSYLTHTIIVNQTINKV